MARNFAHIGVPSSKSRTPGYHRLSCHNPKSGTSSPGFGEILWSELSDLYRSSGLTGRVGHLLQLNKNWIFYNPDCDTMIEIPELITIRHPPIPPQVQVLLKGATIVLDSVGIEVDQTTVNFHHCHLGPGVIVPYKEFDLMNPESIDQIVAELGRIGITLEFNGFPRTPER